MKQREKVLLMGTIGLGLVLSVTYLPGKGRERAVPAEPAAQQPAGEDHSEALPPPATLELLATHRVELKPLAPGMRNPFRPVSTGTSGSGHTVTTPEGTTWEIGMEKVAALKLTGILYERTRLAALINGKPVRAGDRVGDLTVVRVTEHGVVLEYQGERFFKKLFKRLGEPSARKQGPSADEPGDTDWASDDAAWEDDVHND
jgi:hypothetical protein